MDKIAVMVIDLVDEFLSGSKLVLLLRLLNLQARRRRVK